MKIFYWLIGLLIFLTAGNFGYGYLISKVGVGSPTFKGEIVYEEVEGLGFYDFNANKQSKIESPEKLRAHYPNWDDRAQRVVLVTSDKGISKSYVLEKRTSEISKVLEIQDKDGQLSNGGAVWIEKDLVGYLDPNEKGYKALDTKNLEKRAIQAEEFEKMREHQLFPFLDKRGVANRKFTAKATYVETGFITSVGQDALYIRPKYSIYRKKITTGKPLTNLTWLDDYHFLVQDPDRVYLMRVDGTILKQLNGTNYDYHRGK